MQSKILTSLLAAALCAGAAHAQNSSPTATVATPATPAPTVAAAPTASNEPAAQPSATPAVPAPTQIVYTPKLPTVAELTSAASAQGIGIDRVVQTAAQVVVFYRTSNGQTSTVAYQTLPPAGHAPAPVQAVAPAPTTVVYENAPRVVYYDDYPGYYYSPRVWYPPVSLSFGFGYRGGFYRGGGYRHWR